ncbi:MAG: SDR family oxidoreductase [Gammaproteobacteria bacterium]|nr:SDR family oxidoreductase [Gammaproteobacteria bacterium]
MSENLFSVAGKVAFVSGASSGLGEHMAQMLAGRGALVVCAARRLDRLQALAERINAAGGKALAIALDVTDRASVKAALDTTEKEFGTPDIVVANAGATGGQPFLEMDPSVWNNVVDVNLNGVFHLGQEAAQRMVAAGKPGSIINISSICAVSSFKGLTHYSASKAAVDQLTRVMAHELAEHNIRVNALAPGYLMTDMVADYYATAAGQKDLEALPLKRVGELKELDGALLLLASGASSYMSGSVVTADAGHSVRLG